MSTGLALGATQLTSIRGASGRVNIWEGAIRSGKTIGSILRWSLFVAKAVQQNWSGDLVMIGRTRDSVWRNVIGPMMDATIMGDTSIHIKGNHGSPYVWMFGRRVHVMGASDAKAELVLRGLTVVGAYVDEVTTLPKGFFVQLLGRMSPPTARLFGTTNPDGPAHWLKKDFLDRVGKGLDNWRVFHFKLDDNPGLSDAYKASIRSEFTGLWYKRFILGEWVQAEGAIYDSWDESKHLVKAADIPKMDNVLSLGVDYGTTNATAGLLLGVAQGKLWLLDEWAPKSDMGRSLTDAEQSKHLREWLPKRPVESWREPLWVHVDPAAASFRLQLFRDGVPNVAPAWNDVVKGLRTVSSLLATDRLAVSETCTHFREEVLGYVWDPKATEKGEDAPIKLNDHFMDAARYAVMSSTPLWQPYVPTLAA